MRFTLITFADQNFLSAQELSKHNFKKLHPTNSKVVCYSPADLDKYRDEFPILNQKRGAGYWLWKYLLIRDYLLHEARKDEVVLYLDSGACCVGSMEHCRKIAMDIDIVLFNAVSHSYPSYDMLSLDKWCKADTLHLLGGNNVEACKVLPTYCGGYQLYKNSPKSISFLEAIIKTAKFENGRLWDDSPSVLYPESPNFVENRHDQCPLTILAYLRGIHPFRAPVQDNPLWGAKPLLFLHRVRDGSSKAQLLHQIKIN